VSNDLLWMVAHVRDASVRAALLARASEAFEDRDWTDQGAGAGESVVLDMEAALSHDRWALSGRHGDPMLSPTAYWRCRRWVVAEAARDRHPLVPFDATAHAVGDIAARHGTRAAIEFLKDAWTHQQVLAMDDFFLHYHSLLRAQAWQMSSAVAVRELTHGEAAQARSLHERARLLASRGQALGRAVLPLAESVEREFAQALGRLQLARRQNYASFIRSMSAIRPVFYALRDLYWELHYLSGEDESGPFLERERLVDEWQADMFQVQLRPYGEMVGTSLPESVTESAVRRHLAFWTRGRVQLNEEMEALALHAFRHGGVAAMVAELEAATRSALDATQIAALRAYDEWVLDDDAAR
jgi:hypothetical protein